MNELKSRKIYLNTFDFNGLEIYLETMALKGYFPKAIGTHAVFFEREESKNTHYKIEHCLQEKTDHIKDYYHENGWEFLFSYHMEQCYVFHTEASTEFFRIGDNETDIVKAKQSREKESYVCLVLFMIICLICFIAIFVWWSSTRFVFSLPCFFVSFLLLCLAQRKRYRSLLYSLHHYYDHQAKLRKPASSKGLSVLVFSSILLNLLGWIFLLFL